MKVVSAEQMRRIEDRSEEAGVFKDALMENAGLAAARRVRHHVGHLAGVKVVVLVGPGNNGGDGLVTARHLHRWGARVVVYLCRDRRAPDPKLDIVRELGLPILKLHSPLRSRVPASRDAGLARLKEPLASAHVVVDSVLGTGRARPIDGELEAILLELVDARARRPELRVFAMDLPTGLDADTGAVDPVTPPADVTLTLGYPKLGLFAFPGADRVGSLEVLDIGLPGGLDGDVEVELMTPAWAASMLPARPGAAHKGSFGRTLVVAGSRSYTGAAYLAAAAATRVGAGLVTVAIPRSLQMSVASKAAEPTYLPLPESSVSSSIARFAPGPGVVSPRDAASLVLDELDGYDALLVGCGLGQAPETRDFLGRLLLSGATLPPTVVDADGLNFLAGLSLKLHSPLRSRGNGWHERFADRAILTPHPGEMSRLTGEPTTGIQADRVNKAKSSAVEWNKVIALKGAYTVVASPGGKTMLSPFANPGLASAGTGDVLAGAIAGLLSQGLALGDAAALGVYLHGSAGELVRNELGDAGMIASDLLPALPRVVKGLKGR